MEWNTLYCPNPACPYYGLAGAQNWLVKNGTNHGQPQALCRACGRSVQLRHGTAYADLHGDPTVLIMQPLDSVGEVGGQAAKSSKGERRAVSRCWPL